jgi:hypothetical protein
MVFFSSEDQFSIQKRNSEFSRRIFNSANEVSIQRDSMRAGSRQPSRHRLADDAYNEIHNTAVPACYYKIKSVYHKLLLCLQEPGEHHLLGHGASGQSWSVCLHCC